jgi:hypothetical protein
MAIIDGVVGCWSPSVSGGAYCVPDVAKKSANGILVNSTIDSWQAASVRGNSGWVLNHAGTTEKTLNTSRVPVTTVWSVCWWQRLTSLANTPVQLRTNAAVYFHVPYSTNLSFYSSRPTVRPSGAYAANTWQFVAISENGSSAELYLDGIRLGTFTGGSPANLSTGFLYGKILTDSGTTTSDRATGEITIWNRPIAVGEVGEIFRRGNGGVGRILSGQTRRRTYGFIPPTFRAAWIQRAKLIGGGV